VGKTPEVQINNNALDYQPKAAAVIYTIGYVYRLFAFTLLTERTVSTG